MILLWGLRRDAPMAQVHDALLRLGQPVRFLDQRATIDAIGEMSMACEVDATITTSEGILDLASCDAVYLRPYDARDLPVVRLAGPGSGVWERAVQLTELLLSWAQVSPGLVVNRPSAGESNASKPFQARQLRAAGFCVPDTIITTDPDAVAEFREQHASVIYKSISGVRSIVAELRDEQMARIECVRWCPTQFQERVPGTDYRVHVVGTELFAAEIECDAVDYRYAGRQGQPVRMRAASVPDEVAQKCVAASRGMGLELSGVDLRRTADGSWYCFEINPSPGFTYYQAATGQRIDEAVARLLISGTPTPRKLWTGAPPVIAAGPAESRERLAPVGP